MYIYEGKRVPSITEPVATFQEGYSQCLRDSYLSRVLFWTFSCVSSQWAGWHQDRETEFLCRKIMRLAAWICIMAVILWILAKMALL